MENRRKDCGDCVSNIVEILKIGFYKEKKITLLVIRDKNDESNIGIFFGILRVFGKL